MIALLLVAHGSRREASNEEIRDLARQVSEHSENIAAYTTCAFLELSEPSIPDGIQDCIDHGATQIEVFPYFLSRGRHVAEDVPELVKEKKRSCPQVDIRISDYFGARDSVVELLAAEAGASLLSNR